MKSNTEITRFLKQLVDSTNKKYSDIAETALNSWVTRGSLSERQIKWIKSNAAYKRIAIPVEFTHHFPETQDIELYARQQQPVRVPTVEEYLNDSFDEAVSQPIANSEAEAVNSILSDLMNDMADALRSAATKLDRIRK